MCSLNRRLHRSAPLNVMSPKLLSLSCNVSRGDRSVKLLSLVMRADVHYDEV